MAGDRLISTTFKVGAEDNASPTLAKITSNFKDLEKQLKSVNNNSGISKLGDGAKQAITSVTSLQRAYEKLSTAQEQLNYVNRNYRSGLRQGIIDETKHAAFLKQRKHLVDSVTQAQDKYNKLQAVSKISVDKKPTPGDTKQDNKNSQNSGSSVLATGLATTAIASAAVQIVKMADEYKLLQSRINLASTSTDEYTKANTDLLDIANKNGQSLAATSMLYVRIRQGIKDLGGTYEDTMTSISAVSSALRLSGASALEAYSAQLQFSQALASGKLRGDELRSIMENAPALAKALAKGLQVPIGKLYELGEAGSLSTKMVIDALKTQEAELTKNAASIPLTISQSFQVLTNNFEQYIGRLDAATGVTNSISESIKSLASNVETITPIFAGLGAVIGAFALRAAWLAAIPLLFTGIGPLAIAAASGIGLVAYNLTKVRKQAVIFEDIKKSVQSLEKTLSNGTLIERLIGEVEADNVIKEIDALMNTVVNSKINAQKRLEELENSDSVFAAASILEIQKLRKEIEMAQVQLNALSGSKNKAQVIKIEIEDANANSKQASIIDYRSKLGLDKLEAVGGLFGDKSIVNSINAFSDAYKDFAAGVKQNSGEAAASFSGLAISVDNLIDKVQSSDFANLLGQNIAKLEEGATGQAKALLANARLKLVSKIEELQTKELAGTVSLLSDRTSKLKDVQSSIIQNNQVLFNNTFDLKKVIAELKRDVRELNSLDVRSAKFSTTGNQQAYLQEIATIETLAKAKRDALKVDKEAKLQEIQIGDAEVDRNRLAAMGNLFESEKNGVKTNAYSDAAMRALDAETFDKQYAQIANNKVAVEQATASKLRIIDQEVLTSKLKALTTYRDALVSQSNTALQSYKTFAEKVISLDKQIAANRLTTASDVSNIKRQGMNPKQLAEDLRTELASVQNSTRAALGTNDNETAKELLQKQKDLASQIFNSGSGNPEEMKAEAIANMERIGSEMNGILQAERAAAQEAADSQLAVYENLASTIEKLGTQITSLNEMSVINLKANIDAQSLQDVMNTIQAALDSRQFNISVVASNVSLKGNAPEPQGFATGGHIRGAGSGTSDSIPIMASNGEYMMNASVVKRFGVDFFNAINYGGYVPRGFATGGLIDELGTSGGSVNNYIQMPNGGYEKVPSTQSEINDFQNKLARERLKRGSR